MNVLTIWLALAAAALVVCGSGVWLTVRARPYSGAMQNVHKLAALTATVAVVVLAYRGGGSALASPAGWLTATATALLVVVSSASGGVVSANPEAPAWVMWSHRALSWLSVLSAAVLIDALVSKL